MFNPYEKGNKCLSDMNLLSSGYNHEGHLLPPELSLYFYITATSETKKMIALCPTFECFSDIGLARMKSK